MLVILFMDMFIVEVKFLDIYFFFFGLLFFGGIFNVIFESNIDGNCKRINVIKLFYYIFLEILK